jgi:FkbM family methyltransferase
MRKIFPAIAGLALIAGGILAGPKLALTLLWLKSARRNECGLVEALRTTEYKRRFEAAHKRILASARLVETDGDLQLWDVPGARRFWLYKQFDKLNALAFAEQVAEQYWHPAVHVQPGDIVLDCGADYGSVTSYALRAGAKKVVAIEIAPEKIPCLNRTFAKEIAEGRVVVVPVGVWDHDDTVQLGSDSVVLDQNAPKRSVRVVTIDEIVANLRLPRVDFITMDIEGAEKPALRGAVATLRNYTPRMAIASEHLPDDAVAIPATVHKIAPVYDVICSTCAMQDDRIMPMVLFFKPRS